MTDRLNIKEAVVVEGHFDAARLNEVISSPILQTDGFGIFKDKEKQRLIKEFARRCGIIILTDSDPAGFKIRNFVAQLVEKQQVKHAYIKERFGKEKRKIKPSKSELIGVEGFKNDELLQVISDAATEKKSVDNHVLDIFTMYSLGLCGRDNSATKRRSILRSLGLPTRISSKEFCKIIPYILQMTELNSMLDHLESLDQIGQEQY